MNIHTFVIHVYEEGTLHATPTLTASGIKSVFMFTEIV